MATLVEGLYRVHFNFDLTFSPTPVVNERSKLKMNQCREYWEAGEDTNEKNFETERAGKK